MIRSVRCFTSTIVLLLTVAGNAVQSQDQAAQDDLAKDYSIRVFTSPSISTNQADVTAKSDTSGQFATARPDSSPFQLPENPDYWYCVTHPKECKWPEKGQQSSDGAATEGVPDTVPLQDNFGSQLLEFKFSTIAPVSANSPRFVLPLLNGLALGLPVSNQSQPDINSAVESLIENARKLAPAERTPYAATRAFAEGAAAVFGDIAADRQSVVRSYFDMPDGASASCSGLYRALQDASAYAAGQASDSVIENLESFGISARNSNELLNVVTENYSTRCGKKLGEGEELLLARFVVVFLDDNIVHCVGFRVSETEIVTARHCLDFLNYKDSSGNPVATIRILSRPTVDVSVTARKNSVSSPPESLSDALFMTLTDPSAITFENVAGKVAPDFLNYSEFFFPDLSRLRLDELVEQANLGKLDEYIQDKVTVEDSGLCMSFPISPDCIFHACNAFSGYSGTPLIRWPSLKIIGVHHGGGQMDTGGLFCSADANYQRRPFQSMFPNVATSLDELQIE